MSFFMGWLLDQQFGLPQSAWACCGWTVMTVVVPAISAKAKATTTMIFFMAVSLD
jgi:hypothetical protein